MFLKCSRFLSTSSLNVSSVYPCDSTQCRLAFSNSSSSVSPYVMCVQMGSPASLQLMLKTIPDDGIMFSFYCFGLYTLQINRRLMPPLNAVVKSYVTDKHNNHGVCCCNMIGLSVKEEKAAAIWNNIVLTSY